MDGKEGEKTRYTSNKRGTFQRAIENHEEHLKFQKQMHDRAGKGEAYRNLGNSYQSLGDYQKAIEYHSNF